MLNLLEVHDVDAGYGEVGVLRGICMEFPQGQITAVIGSNGAGKTTLMRTISGLLPVRKGAISFDGRDVSGIPSYDRVEAGIALVPEGRMVFPNLTVQETLALGAYAPHARAGARERVDEMYSLFPRLAERRRSLAGSLSGGEQQMLALGRGLMSLPRLLLLDEPSLGLSPVMTEEVFDAIGRIRNRHITIGLIEQNVYSALRICDAAYVLEEGHVVKHGTGQALLGDDDVRRSYLGV